MKKIRVDRNLGKSLDWLLKGKELDDQEKSDVIENRIEQAYPETALPHHNGGNPLNKVSVMALARILDNGYYYALTPEEEVSEIYQEQRRIQNTTKDHKTLFEAEAFANGMRFALQTLGIKIEGVE